METEGSANDEEPLPKKPKKPWVHYEDMLFMKEDIERGNLFVPGEATIITNCNHILKVFGGWVRITFSISLFYRYHEREGKRKIGIQ